MNTFEFATAAKIVFGAGKRDEAAKIAAAFGARGFVVRGSRKPQIAEVVDSLIKAGLQVLEYEIHGEPTVDLAAEAAELARSFQAEFVIGIGGGSVLDTAKIVAALLTNREPIMRYLEVVGDNQPLERPAAPFIAIPTTAGTGSEVTKNGVLAVPEKRVKVSLRHPSMLARAAVIDPELTLSLPPAVTASSGMDALSQVLEPYVSLKRNPITDLFCLEGMRHAGQSLREVYHHGDNLAAREAMSWTALLGGLALANAGLGAVHGLAAPLGGFYEAPHGQVCGLLLPAVCRANLRRLEMEGDRQLLERYQTIARLLTCREDASARDGIGWMEDLVRELRIPRLQDMGAQRSEFDVIAEKALVSNSMKSNPARLTREELVEILEQSY